mmetsp:Transcript_75022/g.150823  ORF Transcript_75022/g.150823 Transcript_75022/m.150823 type:complete len:140 (-) Transcript_75022:98-517(-)
MEQVVNPVHELSDRPKERLMTKVDGPSSSQWVIVIALFFIAGLLEIGGGWLVWQYQREGRSVWWAIAGAVCLVLYGFVPTFQPEEAGEFGRVYAAYGCYFIVLALGWAWVFDNQRPDKGDCIGAVLAGIGAGIITFWPR